MKFMLFIFKIDVMSKEESCMKINYQRAYQIAPILYYELILKNSISAKKTLKKEKETIRKVERNGINAQKSTFDSYA